MTSRRAAIITSILVPVLVVLGAAPAGAAWFGREGGAPWHYWIAWVLAASFFGLVFMLALGYFVRVVMVKYGIKVGKRSGG